ncbi:MAG: heparinase II/III family protein, partial [Rhizobiaceae bacterium]|nr:heparinase II/III family protein [Rhizobiaceae bacterium]
RFLGAPLIAGLTRVPVTREDGDDGQRFTAAHDGYRARYGLVHERSLFLARGGASLEGTDRLTFSGGRAPRPSAALPAAIRFHLHPGVVATRTAEGVSLSARGTSFAFFADAPVDLEDSIFFADNAGARRTLQIVVSFDPTERSEINWRFARAR